jgi:teichuronic acid biosynthesis glycosyltransferase TuaC
VKRTPIAHVIFPRPSLDRPVPEFAWEAVRAVASTPDLDVTVLVPVPAPLARRAQGAMRRARGAAAWPEGIDEALLALEPRPVLVPYLPVPRRSVEAATATLAAHLVRRNRALRPRVVQGSFLDEGGYAAAMLGRVVGCPSVAVAHGTDVRAARGEVPGEIGRRRRALETLRAADRVLAVSAELAQSLAVLGVRAEVVRFTSSAERFPLCTVRPRAAELLFVGRVGRAKGVDLLLEAVAKQRHRDVRVRLVGPEVGDLDVLSTAARLGLAGRVELLGERPHAELPALYATSSCLVLPSRSEGLPCVLVEALLTGRPVVATDVGGVSELVDDTVGRLVPAGDAFQLAAALDQVVDAQRDGRFDPAALRARALPMTWEVTAPVLAGLTRELLRGAA